MTLTAERCELRDERSRFHVFRPHDYGLANALARKIRREHPSKAVDAVVADFGLTVGEARGVVNATASRTTIDKAIKAGGWALAVELFADVIGQPLEHYIEAQAKEAADERARWEARERDHKVRLAAVAELGLGDRRAS